MFATLIRNTLFFQDKDGCFIQAVKKMKQRNPFELIIDKSKLYGFFNGVSLNDPKSIGACRILYSIGAGRILYISNTY